MARPKFDFMQHLKLIERLSYYALSKRQIAERIGCSKRTFQRRLVDDPYVQLALTLGENRRKQKWDQFSNHQNQRS